MVLTIAVGGCVGICSAADGASMARDYTGRNTQVRPLELAAAPLARESLPAPAVNGEEWLPGRDYSVLMGQRKLFAPADKIEVLELFLYTSDISYELQTRVHDWLKNKPNYVYYVRQPAVAFPHARLQAKIFFTLEELGRADLNAAMFDWIRVPEHSSIYHVMRTPSANAYLALTLKFAAKHSLDVYRFATIYESEKIQEKMLDAEIATHAYEAVGTSTFVINGKYSTSIQRITEATKPIDPYDFTRLFNLVDYLVSSEANRAKL
jgi:protein dithiol oxidoreductase (disulfide-forming)